MPQTDAWGIKVANVEMGQVDLTESMIRAIARQAEAGAGAAGQVIHAEGELQARKSSFQAARVLAQEPQAILLRYLETLTVIGADKNTTVVFPLPMDLVAPLLAKTRQEAARRRREPERRAVGECDQPAGRRPGRRCRRLIATVFQLGLWAAAAVPLPQTLYRDARLTAAIVLGSAALTLPDSLRLICDGRRQRRNSPFPLSTAWSLYPAGAAFPPPLRPLGSALRPAPLFSTCTA